MLKQMKLAALKKAEEEELTEENTEIEKMSKANEEKHKKKMEGKKTLAQAYSQKYPEDKKQ
jgi:hypothetical protein